MTIRFIKRSLAIWGVNHLFRGTRCFSQKRVLMRFAGYDVGDETKIVGPIACTGHLIVGKNCWIGKNLMIHGNGTVQIADNCDLAPDVTFLTGGHALGSESRRAGVGETYQINVGDGVWIGARATIGRNVKIGSGSVIAACACVMQDIAPNTLVGGVPAKVIKELDHASAQNTTK